MHFFFTGGCFIIILFYLPLYFQGVQGLSPTASGIHVLPFVVPIVVSAFVSGALISRIGYANPFLFLGPVMLTVGMGLLSTISAHSVFGQWFGYQIIAGAGQGMSLQVQLNHGRFANFQTPNMSVQAVVSLFDIPVATAITLFFTQAGYCIFLAAAQAVLLNQLLPRIQTLNPEVTAYDLIHAGAIGLKQLVAEEQIPELLVAYAESLNRTFKIGIATAGVAAIMALGVEWISIKRKVTPSVQNEKE